MSLTPFSLRTLPDHLLLEGLRKLASRDRELEADLLVHLGEVDARELYLGQAYSSMFGYCTEALHFSEAVAYQRITAARAARGYPLLLERLRTGELHLAGVRLLAPHLTRENRRELIDRARYRSKRLIEELLADRSPKPDAAALVRRLPATSEGPASPSREAKALPPAASPATRPAAPLTSPPGHTPVSAPALPCRHPEPLGAQRYRVQFTASTQICEKLREAQALLRHQIPDGDLAKLFDRALTALLREVRRSRFAETDTPRASAEHEPATSPCSRHIPAAVRRQVVQRDQGRCTFVARNGRRCDSRDALEFHHLEPFARSARHSVEGIALRCRAHNRHAASADYGAEHIARFRKRNGEEIAVAARPGTSSPEAALH